MNMRTIEYTKLPAPQKDCTHQPILLSDETMKQRTENVFKQIDERGLDCLIIYCDVEHSANFEYLIGFYTRFEEGLLILHKNREAVLVLGNENLNKASKARLTCKVIHAPHFSLPNQPMNTDKTFTELLGDAGITSGMRIGMVGWKHFTSRIEDNRHMIDGPAFIVQSIHELIGPTGCLENHTDLMIGEHGVRCVNNANEIAHYEYGASLASDAMLDAMNQIQEGVSELQLGQSLLKDGQPTTVVTIAASGERFIKGNMFPTHRCVQKQDPISLTVGYKGGLSSRSGVAVAERSELSGMMQNYMEIVAMPYFNAYVTWLETIQIGMQGQKLYEKIAEVLPKATYHWSLCPGHLSADEEWLSSPIYEHSTEVIKSGMIFQIDIIPSVPGYASINAESTVILADQALRKQIQHEYPDLWQRICRRRDYLMKTLNIQLREEILPMCSTVAYLRPYLLNHACALRMSE